MDALALSVLAPRLRPQRRLLRVRSLLLLPSPPLLLTPQRRLLRSRNRHITRSYAAAVTKKDSGEHSVMGQCAHLGFLLVRSRSLLPLDLRPLRPPLLLPCRRRPCLRRFLLMLELHLLGARDLGLALGVAE